MNDTIFIRGLSIQTVIGTYSYERTDTQEIILDLDLETDAANAGKDDDLEKTVDYAVLIHSIRGWADGRSDGLLESFAEHLATTCSITGGKSAVSPLPSTSRPPPTC